MEGDQQICYTEFLRASKRYASLYDWTNKSGLADRINAVLNAKLASIDDCGIITIAEDVAYIRMASEELRDLIFKTLGNVPICSNVIYTIGATHPGVQIVRTNGSWDRLSRTDEHLVNWAANSPTPGYLEAILRDSFFRQAILSVSESRKFPHFGGFLAIAIVLLV